MNANRNVNRYMFEIMMLVFEHCRAHKPWTRHIAHGTCCFDAMCTYFRQKYLNRSKSFVTFDLYLRGTFLPAHLTVGNSHTFFCPMKNRMKHHFIEHSTRCDVLPCKRRFCCSFGNLCVFFLVKYELIANFDQKKKHVQIVCIGTFFTRIM